ncbi:MAG: NAD(P)(+) transhydrogenase (Re/Si-specific) subunit beta, partial [Bacteroidota bacterium]
MSSALVNIVYLIAAVLFVLGLKGLAHPRTAVRGNLLGAMGMFIAVVVTLLDRQIVSFEVILVGVVIGSTVGATVAVKIRMTAMPQLVGLLNGLGGGASALVAGAALVEAVILARELATDFAVATATSGLIGGVAFWGSLVAFGKLEGIITESPVL